LIEEAVECMNRTGQRLFEAELHRMKGEILIADCGMRNAESGKENPQSAIRNPQSEAEDCFRHALDCARRQGAKSWELSAALSLSRLWRGQGKHEEARTLLAEIYGWFMDTSAGGLRSAGGFESRDLKEAKALLEELG
jgi:predicted ATPase